MMVRPAADPTLAAARPAPYENAPNAELGMFAGAVNEAKPADTAPNVSAPTHPKLGSPPTARQAAEISAIETVMNSIA